MFVMFVFFMFQVRISDVNNENTIVNRNMWTQSSK